jgi:NAD(P)H-hydrate repair Nnr-like enzyme with NAD(P)H-hydrate dehydratase domain
MHTYDAAIAAVWIHGRAADVLAQEVGEDSYISSDLARALGRAFSDYAAAVSAAP